MEPAENMMKDLRAVLADAEELLRATADEAGPKVQEVRARAEESLRAAREHLKSAGGELDSQVRANPWAAVGIAAGVGLVVGILLSRK
ncbi:MAG TPA: DUF883 family protein [Burkholderiales bacterium]|jgi:ElaB/YqjD/DUF883 family membrane-anchored ribosome-binding protein|nr:DUF883 family protein [Burkholderiales bacterium]